MRGGSVKDLPPHMAMSTARRDIKDVEVLPEPPPVPMHATVLCKQLSEHDSDCYRLHADCTF
jgi:hypothetical protein